MYDNWCRKVWDGSKWLYGAAAREYRLGQAGGVDAVVSRAVTHAFQEVNDLIRATNSEDGKVVSISEGRRPKITPKAPKSA
jgi:hypothetical protein